MITSSEQTMVNSSTIETHRAAAVACTKITVLRELNMQERANPHQMVIFQTADALPTNKGSYAKVDHSPNDGTVPVAEVLVAERSKLAMVRSEFVIPYK